MIYKKNVGIEHKDYLNTINLLAVTYSNIGQNYKAEPLLVEVSNIYKNKYGEESADYAASLNKMAKVYVETGQYTKAEPIFLTVVAITKKISGEANTEYATYLNNLGLLYKSIGKYAKAEPLLMKALLIRKEKTGENSLDYANSISNLASLYQVLGQYAKAESFYTQATKIFKEKAGESHPDYATSLNNLALLFRDIGEYQKAIQTFTEALAIQKKALGEDHPAYLITINNLAGTYEITGEYTTAEKLYLQAIEREKESLGEKHPDYFRSLNDLAFLYRQKKEYFKAEKLYLQVIPTFKEVLGENHPDYAAALNNLSAVYESMGKYGKAETLLSQSKAIETRNLLNVFTVLSEKEKSDYITKQSVLNHSANSFLYNYPAATPAFYGSNYDLQLLLKGLALADTKNVLDVVRNNSDTTIRKIFSAWQNNKMLLSKQYSLPLVNRREDIEQIEEQTEQKEKELNAASVLFRKQQEATNITWKDVQTNLAADEAAIEFVSFNLYNKEWTDTTIYAAYIIRKNDPAPLFVYLTEEKKLSQLIDSAGKTATILAKNFYRGLEIENKGSGFLGDSLYQLIWQPLEPFLKGIKKIAYSPAGRLYSIAFNAIATKDSGALLMDKYQLNQYTSTRQLALRLKNNTVIKPTSIILFGNASFSMDSLQIIKQKRIQKADSTISTNIYTTSDRNLRGGVWNNLPGTSDEVKKIASFFNSNKISNKTFTQTSATEENLKKISNNSPQILHIATHGFFLPPSDNERLVGSNKGNIFSMSADPLLRNGIILAGANYAWSGKKPINGVDDAIVTAYEISQLNLSNTELVVLSACETALGDIKGSEGVFGLQRAFKMAGVKKMIASLWQVPDKETSELMTSFYSYWIKGKTINEAFTQAQADMRKKYSPFYWAAFVLVE